MQIKTEYTNVKSRSYKLDHADLCLAIEEYLASRGHRIQGTTTIDHEYDDDGRVISVTLKDEIISAGKE